MVLRVVEIIRLTRAVNCLLAAVGVWIGAYLTWLAPAYYGPMVASLAAAFVCAAGNIVNDMVDVEIDRINRPSRVLVRGTISMKTARNMAIALNLIAVVLSLVVSLPVAMMALVAIALLLVYNLWLKKVPVVGNIAVALLAGLTFLTGGLAVDPALAFRLPGPLIPFVFAFFMHLVREIVKDVQDIEGDRRAGVVTFPQVIGVSGSLLVALGLLLTLAVLTYVPIFEGWFGRTYEIITVYLVDLPLLALMIFVWGNPNRLMLAIGSAGLKAGMLLGLIALVLA
ncbi:MAG: hypothetical protein DRP45_02575 [Candidatus Zixiibacteriota bacterium]|nr:MAG: hypothetical protein DRP45_02575 [candidate division Zixibacteria bacterium]